MSWAAYLFDFDYTLVDSTAGIVGCFNRTLAAFGRPRAATADIQRTIGLPMRVAAATLLRSAVDDPVMDDFLARYHDDADLHMTDGTRFYPEALETLRSLRRAGKRIAIVSSKTAYRIREALERDGVADCVEFVIGSHDVREPKPDPEGVNAALARMSLARADAVYVGDSVVDAETARNAAVAFIGVTTGVTSADALAAYPHLAIVPTLREIM